MKRDLLTELVLRNAELMEHHRDALDAGRPDVAAEIRKAGFALMAAVSKLGKEEKVVA